MDVKNCLVEVCEAWQEKAMRGRGIPSVAKLCQALQNYSKRSIAVPRVVELCRTCQICVAHVKSRSTPDDKNCETPHLS